LKNLLLLILIIPFVSGGQTITTIAGNGAIGRGGDGAQATNAQVFFPFGVTTDKAGNIFIADDYNYAVRKITPAGIISTIAGNPVTGFSGENGPATIACFTEITSVAIDWVNNVYIADNGNRRIRKVNKSGTVNTLCGNGSDSYSGDGGRAINAGLGDGPVFLQFDARGDLLFSDNSNVRMVTTASNIVNVAGRGEPGYSGDGGPATAAGLMKPKGLAIDTAGNIFIADYDDNRVRKINRAGIITTYAGNGYKEDPGFGAFYGDGGPATDAELSGPTGLAIDGAGNLFIADYNNHCVRRVDAATGKMSTVAGSAVNGYSGDGGPATAAKFVSVAGIAVDASGNLYICDPVNNRVRMVEKVGVPFAVPKK